jgi:hypothetical protein
VNPFEKKKHQFKKMGELMSDYFGQTLVMLEDKVTDRVAVTPNMNGKRSPSHAQRVFN